MGPDSLPASGKPRIPTWLLDGYAVQAADTFGCSDAIPAILSLAGEISMGKDAAQRLAARTCVSIPTGGAVPPGADAVVMLEYTENYGDNTAGVIKPIAPGANIIFKGDDLRPGAAVLPAGRLLAPQDIGTLAAMGAAKVSVYRRPVVGTIPTGDNWSPKIGPEVWGDSGIQLRHFFRHVGSMECGCQNIPNCSGQL